MTRMHSTLLATAALAGVLATACDSDSPTSPSSIAIATIQVGNEAFQIALTTTEQVAAARAALSGGPARIPIGRVVQGTQVNTGWSWHLEEVAFVEVAIELCDGRPSDVERAVAQFGGGRFCPWSATVLRVG
jgi:hypothetical protein